MTPVWSEMEFQQVTVSSRVLSPTGGGTEHGFQVTNDGVVILLDKLWQKKKLADWLGQMCENNSG